jgi:hypothetical protein
MGFLEVFSTTKAVMNEARVTFLCIPNPVPGAAGRLRQTMGLSVIFV